MQPGTPDAGCSDEAVTPRWRLEAGHRGASGAFIVEEMLGEIVWARVQGNLDMAASAVVARQVSELFKLPIRELYLDLSGVTFIDSSGIGALILARAQAALQDIAFMLEGLPEVVRSTLEIAGLASTFSIRDNQPGPVDAPGR
jgi:anti-sigma B factor antagonist